MIKQDGDKCHVHVILIKELRDFAEKEAERLGMKTSVYIRMLIAQERERKES